MAEPFFARLTGMFGFFVCRSYATVELLGKGILGVYVGVFTANTWMALFVPVAFREADWPVTAVGLLRERGSIESDD